MDSLSNEETCIYWFRAQCKNDLKMTFTLSVYEEYVGIVIYGNNLSIASLDMENGLKIGILDEKKRILEIVHDNGRGRCLLDLSGDTLFLVTHFYGFPNKNLIKP